MAGPASELSLLRNEGVEVSDSGSGFLPNRNGLAVLVGADGAAKGVKLKAGFLASLVGVSSAGFLGASAGLKSGELPNWMESADPAKVPKLEPNEMGAVEAVVVPNLIEAEAGA